MKALARVHNGARIHASHCSNKAEIDIQCVRLNSSQLVNNSHFTLLALDVCAIAIISAPRRDTRS